MTDMTAMTAMTAMTDNSMVPNASLDTEKESLSHQFKRIKVKPLLKDYLSAIGALDPQSNTIQCPYCNSTSNTLITGYSWQCIACDKKGDVVDYVLADYEFDDISAINHINRTLGNKITYFEGLTANELMTTELEEPETIIDPILCNGLYILAGAPKIGKSWLVMQIAHAVSTGENLWNFRVNQSDVIYLDLEEPLREMQERLDRITGGQTGNILMVNEAEQLRNGLEDQIISALTDNPNYKVVIIDTLQKIRMFNYEKPNYAHDYNDMSGLKKIADNFKIAIVLVHHTRKQLSSDPFEMISGSQGLFGAADGSWVLIKEDRLTPYAKLHITGRKTADMCLTLKFDTNNMHWDITEDSMPENIYKDLVLESVAEVVKINGGEWSGTATDLAHILLNQNVSISSAVLARKLNTRKRLLEEQYGISVVSTRTSEQRNLHLYSCNTENAELEDDK